MRPRVYGPRSLILTTIERPLSRFVTFANEAIGSERCAAVAVTVSRISPLAVCLPTRLYQAAFPNCLVPAGRPGLQQESRTLHRFARGSRLARRGRGALGAIVGRPAFLSSCTGEVAGIGRQFCAPWGNTRGVNRAVGCAVFFRGGCRTGGCHQTREANTDCSMHWHCIVSFLLGIPLPVAMNLAVPCQITLDG